MEGPQVGPVLVAALEGRLVAHAKKLFQFFVALLAVFGPLGFADPVAQP